MRQLILFAAFLFIAGSVSAQTDTTKQPKDTTTAPGTTTTTEPTKTKTTTQVAKSNNDSITLMKDLDYQQHHPEWLYQRVLAKDSSENVIRNAEGKLVRTKKLGPALLIGLILVAGLGIWLLSTTSLCRDQSYDPQTNQLRPVKERPFSYSKIQLFWWSIIILTSFTVFYFYTHRLAAFTPTMVLLLGGGLAVSLFGKVIDNNQMQQDNEGVPTRHQDLQPSQGLFIDILSDESGISIHRFQSIILNIVFGVAFVISFFEAIQAIQFPFIDFETWQLTLLGISSGAYLGFKTNENTEATKEKRQIEAVKVANKTAAANTTDEITTMDAVDNAPEKSATSPAPKTTAAYQRLKSKLEQKGMMNE